MLFGILILIFLIVVFGMNFMNTRLSKEGFVTNDSKQGDTEKQVRAVLDPMTSPDGEELCSVFTMVRDTLAKNEAAGKNLDDAEIAKRVEATLESKIPGGALPCPLLKYPASDATDMEWLSFVQSIPEDFGARVVLMAVYADSELSSIASQMQAVIGGNVTIPKVPLVSGTPAVEPFINVCPPRIAKKKRDDNEEAACKLPESLSPQEVKEGITSVLQVLVDTKNAILQSKGIIPSINIHTHVVNAKKAATYLKQKQTEIQAGTFKLSNPIAGLS